MAGKTPQGAAELKHNAYRMHPLRDSPVTRDIPMEYALAQRSVSLTPSPASAAESERGWPRRPTRN